MPDQLAAETRKPLLDAAVDEALRRGDRRLGTEHLLLGLLHDERSPVARALGVSLSDARATADALDAAALAAVGVEPGSAAQKRPLPLGRRIPQLTSGARAVLKEAGGDAQLSGRGAVEVSRVLLAVLSLRRPDPAAELLQALGVDLDAVRVRLAGGADVPCSVPSAAAQERRRLPAHHIGRPRLTATCLDASIVVVEAAGGYGKSVLAAELVDTWGSLPLWVSLEEGGVTARLFVARLRGALGYAGLTAAAGAMAAVGDDLAGAVDSMLAATRGESCALVVDDAHHADAGTAVLIDRLAERLTSPQRLVVLARHLPAGLERLRRAGPLHLSAADLALRPEETLQLCRTGFGLQVSAEDGALLDAATGGWTAATVLAASRSKRTERPLAALARMGSFHLDAIQSILEEALSAAGADRALFARIAMLPLLDRDLLALVSGEESLLERALDWGLPMTRVQGGWWVLPEPVREHLAAPEPPDSPLLRTAAAYYRRRGALGTALQMLLGSGDVEGVAAVLGEADPWVIDTVDALELLSVLDSVPDGVLERFPRAMLTVARCCAGSWMTAHSNRLMARADAVVSEATAPELRRALDVELLVQAINSGDARRAELGARRVLASVGPDERLTRARALTVLGQALCQRRDESGRLEVAALTQAADHLQQASEAQLRLGNRTAAATITIFRALWVEFALGRAQRAAEILNTGLALAADHRRRFAQILWCRAHVLTELGRQAEVDADLDEVMRISDELGDGWIVPYVAWERMVCASLRADVEATISNARQAQAESRTGYWWNVDGAEFLADAADCLDRVGSAALAAEYLEQAQHNPQKARAQIAMAECALAARHGDPELALTRLAAAPGHGIAPRELWRVTLLRAYAMYRRAEPDCGAVAARALEQAAALGQPQLPLVRERELTVSLLALASETRLPAAVTLDEAALPVTLAVLGRFELARGGRTVPVGEGQEARLLKLVAANGGSVHVDQAIEAIWPMATPETGRNRLRTVLNRLHQRAPAVVARQGERLMLRRDVGLDIREFMREAREAQVLRAQDPTSALAVARSAIARYRGSLLPDDPYEEWAEEPREAVRRAMLDLLDLCAEAAARRGDLDEARRMVERSITLDPYDDQRYLEVASILHEQGRKGAALSVLRRARAALAELGVDAPVRLAQLERQVSTARDVHTVGAV